MGPGTWTSPVGDSCCREKLTGFSGDLEADGLGGLNVVITIKHWHNIPITKQVAPVGVWLVGIRRWDNAESAIS